jgi:hypothetical protein
MKNIPFTSLMLGSPSGHSNREQNDFYATEPKAIELLLKLEQFNKNIWEPCAGLGHISEVLKKNGYNVTSTDLISRGYGTGGVDFLKINKTSMNTQTDYDIITNPPYKNAILFVEKALDLVQKNNKVAMFLKIQFLEGNKRRKLFEKHPPKTIYVPSARLNCAKNADFATYKSSALCICWFIWEKGYKGDTIIKWFN